MQSEQKKDQKKSQPPDKNTLIEQGANAQYEFLKRQHPQDRMSLITSGAAYAIYNTLTTTEDGPRLTEDDLSFMKNHFKQLALKENWSFETVGRNYARLHSLGSLREILPFEMKINKDTRDEIIEIVANYTRGKHPN